MDIPMVDKPNMISIEIHISDILKINDRDFSITFSLYFNVMWKEPRLRLNPSFFQNRSDLINPLRIIWLVAWHG
jgi:Neurotransmitter-gated ion-channel ligand binding domain